MGVDRTTFCPILDDPVDPAPEWKIDIGGVGDVFEQPHPKRRQRFVIKIANAVVRGKRGSFRAFGLMLAPEEKSPR